MMHFERVSIFLLIFFFFSSAVSVYLLVCCEMALSVYNVFISMAGRASAADKASEPCDGRGLILGKCQ